MGLKWLSAKFEASPFFDDEWFEAYAKETDTLFIAMLVVFITTIIILICASKIGLEDFEMIEYLVMTVSVFTITAVWYVIISIGLDGLLVNTILTETKPLEIRAVIFVSSLLVLFWPLVFAVKSSFMFLKPRLVLAAVFTVMIALGLTFYIV